jgi:hypothetical protein
MGVLSSTPPHHTQPSAQRVKQHINRLNACFNFKLHKVTNLYREQTLNNKYWSENTVYQNATESNIYIAFLKMIVFWGYGCVANTSDYYAASMLVAPIPIPAVALPPR